MITAQEKGTWVDTFYRVVLLGFIQIQPNSLLYFLKAAEHVFPLKKSNYEFCGQGFLESRE